MQDVTLGADLIEAGSNGDVMQAQDRTGESQLAICKGRFPFYSGHIHNILTAYTM